MANPQKENGFTPIANELLEAFYRCKLLEYERCVVMCIWRKTYGWNKKEDWVSNSQIFEETGIVLPNITRTIKSLVAKKILIKKGKLVSVNKNYEEWVVSWRKLSHQITQVISPDNKKLSHQIPTKEKRNYTKDITERSSEGLNANQENMSWNRQPDDVEEITIDLDSGEQVGNKKPNLKTTAEMKMVFDLFDHPAKRTWHLKPVQRLAAQTLFDEYGIETLTKRMNTIKKLQKEYKDDKFLPTIVSPNQLLDKMEAVERYLKQL